jgi:hypothetical protein
MDKANPFKSTYVGYFKCTLPERFPLEPSSPAPRKDRAHSSAKSDIDSNGRHAPKRAKSQNSVPKMLSTSEQPGRQTSVAVSRTSTTCPPKTPTPNQTPESSSKTSAHQKPNWARGAKTHPITPSDQSRSVNPKTPAQAISLHRCASPLLFNYNRPSLEIQHRKQETVITGTNVADSTVAAAATLATPSTRRISAASIVSSSITSLDFTTNQLAEAGTRLEASSPMTPIMTNRSTQTTLPPPQRGRQQRVNPTWPPLNAPESVLVPKSAALPPINKVMPKALAYARQNGECTVCMDRQSNCVLYRCGHVCCCFGCGKRLKTCPICRKPVEDVIKIYNA